MSDDDQKHPWDRLPVADLRGNPGIMSITDEHERMLAEHANTLGHLRRELDAADELLPRMVMTTYHVSLDAARAQGSANEAVRIAKQARVIAWLFGMTATVISAALSALFSSGVL